MASPSTYLSIANLPTLPATSDNALIAGWAGALSAGDAFPVLADTGAAGIDVTITATSGGTQFDVTAFDSGSVEIFALSFLSASFFDDNNFHSFAVSVDTTAQVVQLLIDTNLKVILNTDSIVTWNSSHQIAFFPHGDGWQMGPVASNGIVSMSDFRFGAGEGFFDLSVDTNALKVFSAQNTPVPWGSQGQDITGQVPATYLHGFGADYGDNLGSGGPWTVHGMFAIFSPEVCAGAEGEAQAPQVVWTDAFGNVIVDSSGNVLTVPP